MTQEEFHTILREIRAIHARIDKLERITTMSLATIQANTAAIAASTAALPAVIAAAVAAAGNTLPAGAIAAPDAAAIDSSLATAAAALAAIAPATPGRFPPARKRCPRPTHTWPTRSSRSGAKSRRQTHLQWPDHRCRHAGDSGGRDDLCASGKPDDVDVVVNCADGSKWRATVWRQLEA